MKYPYRLLALVIVCFMSLPAFAHKPSDSYLRISPGKTIAMEWDIGLRDLEYVIGLDTDQSGDVTWGELKARRDEIVAYALSRLKVRVNEQDCRLTVTGLRVARHSDGSYACLQIQSDATTDVEGMEIHYSLLFDVDPTHRGLVLFDNGHGVSTHVLSPAESCVTVNSSDTSWFSTFDTYVREGIWHIWIGFDHILFLMALLLPAVLMRREDGWQPIDGLGPAIRTVAKIVTVFTVAHSITLWLAVMEYVTIPSQWIESTIAFSIVLTACSNLYPRLRVDSWIIAFVFGLIHGFGFANVLLDLGLSNVALGISLLGFNLGVEFGQLAIVVAFLPLAFLLRKTRFYELIILKFGSVAIAVMGAVWMCERIFNLEILGI